MAGPCSEPLRFRTETGRGHVGLEIAKSVLVGRFGAITSRSDRFGVNFGLEHLAHTIKGASEVFSLLILLYMLFFGESLVG